MERQITKKYRLKVFTLRDLMRIWPGDWQDDDYDWGTLEESLKEDGYSPAKHKYIEVQDVRHDQGFKDDYVLVDGVHRCKILFNLYGGDLELKCKVEEIDTVDGKKFLKPDGDDTVCPHCFKAIKGCSCKIAKSNDGFDVHHKCLNDYNKRMQDEKDRLLKMIKERENAKREEYTQGQETK